MGVFRQMKDMKDMVAAAPEMVAQARQIGAQAQEMAAAQQAALQAQQAAAWQAQAQAYQAPGSFAQDGPEYEPIAGVSLEQYARVSKGVAAFGYDQAKLPEVAASHGIAAMDWADAFAGWNQRIKANPAVAKQFNLLYRSV
jgi:hypothetical protein